VLTSRLTLSVNVMQPKEIQLEVAVARWVLGLVPGEELPAIAVHALEIGLDTPALSNSPVNCDRL
jgi:hypothetical protein